MEKYGVILTLFVADEKLKDKSIGIADDMTEDQIDRITNLVMEIYKENSDGYKG